MCPFLVPVTADQLWVTRAPGYCRRPARRLRVLARATVLRFCTTPAYVTCPGYRESANITPLSPALAAPDPRG